MEQVKILLGVLVLGITAGCETLSEAIPSKIVYVDKPVPVECPQPSNIPRPPLKIVELSEKDKQDPGKVAQYYKASMLQLQGYATQLELSVDVYRTTPKSSPVSNKEDTFQTAYDRLGKHVQDVIEKTETVESK